MQSNLNNYRKTYSRSELTREQLDENPMQQFRTWFHEVDDSESIDEANAMTISSLSEDGYPKSRIVLLKSYDEYGFVFYTNYDSEKGKALIKYPKACLSFFWPSFERQVIIKGNVEKVSKQVSENYFSSRPKGSQLGALVSPQSEVVENREVLEQRLNELEEIYKNKQVEKPDNWGGFLVKPKSIEFWQGRPNRLHDRFLFTLQEDFNWKIERLAP
ncbi:pyridoxamine 5'-phosphate oxidase [Psychroflexus halocasei]|uniref:Pyridoxine/pyridoxamine 5'-phosphate oxidase n=1 Tax=Psychroflexus halocasei TaxID=908615 RepID=A0A1H3XL92_9FLAO|nr:pyridoxamine 5'-phosphate oxidase [Psychroflexus halocasei]SEA00207.1 pyridoxamine 5'-phosphate oxidase [Psychroflexus halocasei]